MGIIDEINEIIHKGYTELRKSYIKKFKYYLEVNHRWARLIDNSYYGPESRGIFGGQL
jgi:hypothetical protein